MIGSAESSTLLLVDVQERLMPAIERGQNVVDRCLSLARSAQILDVPIVVTEQNPKGLGHSVAEIRELGCRTVSKMAFDANRNRELENEIQDARKHVVLAGCEAHVCVLQTAFGLMQSGYEVAISLDCIGSRRPLDLNAAVARAQSHGAEIVTSEMVIFEWMQDCNHEKFRDVLKNVK